MTRFFVQTIIGQKVRTSVRSPSSTVEAISLWFGLLDEICATKGQSAATKNDTACQRLSAQPAKAIATGDSAGLGRHV